MQNVLRVSCETVTIREERKQGSWRMSTCCLCEFLKNKSESLDPRVSFMLQGVCSVLANNVRGQFEHLSVLKNVNERAAHSFIL